MISGRDAYASIERAAMQLRSDGDRLEAALRSASETAARLRLERAEALRRLAQARLDAYSQEGVVGGLDLAEREAVSLMERWRAGLADHDRRRSDAERAVAAAEAEREARADALEAVVGELTALRETHEAEMRADEAWRVQAARVEDARHVAEEARLKADQAEVDLGEKRKPYDSDPLFGYLWRRRFGTSDYESRGLTRLIDSWVARLIGFEGARANYHLLTEIPVRLREHAARQVQAVETEEAALAERERAILAKAGLEPLEAKLKNAQASLDQAEEALIAARHERDALVADGSGETLFDQAVERLAKADAGDTITELYRQAAQTRSAADDEAVRRIEEIDRRLAETEREAAGIRGQIRDLARRRAEIESQRDSFHRRGYDRPGGGFGNPSALNDILTGILVGTLRGRALDDALRGGWNPPPSSPWGRGSSGGHSGGSPWGGGSSGGGSSGGDGFRTGGGF